MSKLQKVWNRGVKRYSISSYKGRNMQVLWEKISSELGIGFHYEYFYSCYLGNYLLINKYIHYGNSILDNNYYIFVHILSNHSYLSDGRGKRQRITQHLGKVRRRIPPPDFFHFRAGSIRNVRCGKQPDQHVRSADEHKVHV